MMDQSWRRECCELMNQPAPDEPKVSLSFPGSQCPNCGSPIRPWHNIPVLSWVWLRGRCDQCRDPIPVRYPLVELVTGLLSAAAAWHFGFGQETASALVLIWMLIALNLFGIWTPLSSAVLGAILGYGSLWSVYWLFKLATGKEGMGYGDFKLLAALGAWFGWHAVPLMILLSSFVGAALGIAILVAKQQGRDTPMPFGPYLAGAGLLTLFFGDSLLNQYLSMVAL